MEVRNYYTEKSFKQAVKLAKAEGHKFLGYNWYAACFNDLILIREY